MMKDKKHEDCDVYFMTTEEYRERLSTASSAILEMMEVEKIMQMRMRDRALKAGLIPDEDWMKKL